MDGYAALLEMGVYCPQSFSLKDKRSTIHGIIDRLRERFNVSVAEVEKQDHHRQATLLLALVASERKQLDKVINRIEEEVATASGLQLRSFEVQFY